MGASPTVYDPKYDPLVATIPGVGQDYAPTYWIATAGVPPADDGRVQHDMDVDVAIIGSGYTGLATAIHLARSHNIKATVLEANRLSWGCSTRNGGQAQCAVGRLKRSQWIERWGKETAIALHHETCHAMERFKQLIADIDCEPQSGGHLYIAHKPSVMADLQRESEICNRVFGYQTQVLDTATLHDQYIGDQEAAGALHEPQGIGIHAGKLAFGYLRTARQLGAQVYTASPVLDWQYRQGGHYLYTPGGTLRARAVAVATGGYTAQTLHRNLRNRIMPILSNSVVTRPLSEAEIKQCRLHTTHIVTDTRILRHYYRFMPDGRLQIGGRSAITGRCAPKPRYENYLRRSLARKFPALGDIELDYSWWGWVDVAHDMMPRIYQPDPKQPTYYAMGYGGNGVMYSAQAGKHLADRIAGKKLSNVALPIFQSPLPYPHVLSPALRSKYFSPFRRLGQRLLYRWYCFKDEL